MDHMEHLEGLWTYKNTAQHNISEHILWDVFFLINSESIISLEELYYYQYHGAQSGNGVSISYATEAMIVLAMHLLSGS